MRFVTREARGGLRDDRGADPRVDYEERVRGGSIVRDAEGNPIGACFIDLRSRGTNRRTEGVLFMY